MTSRLAEHTVVILSLCQPLFEFHSVTVLKTLILFWPCDTFAMFWLHNKIDILLLESIYTDYGIDQYVGAISSYFAYTTINPLHKNPYKNTTRCDTSCAE